MRLNFGMRLVLRKAVKDGTISKENAKNIMRDPDKLGLLIEMAEEAAKEDALFTGEDGPIISFLKYLIENPEKLSKFIEIIMALFAV